MRVPRYASGLEQRKAQEVGKDGRPWLEQRAHARHSIQSPHLLQCTAVLYKHPVGFGDAGMNDAVFEIFDVDHRTVVLSASCQQIKKTPDRIGVTEI